MKPFSLFLTHCSLTFLVLSCFFSFSAHASKTPPPHVRLVDIWAYGDIVTDSTLLATEQNNLRFYCTTVEQLPTDSVSYEFQLKGYDKDWFEPFPEGWYFYTNLQPGDYVFRARCRYEGGEWGPVTEHPFTIACPWWRTWWAYLIYIFLSLIIVFELAYLIVRTIRLHNKLKLAQETNRFRTNFILEASRQFHIPISIILSVTQKLTGSQDDHLTRTDVQHLRNSCKQLMQMTEDLVDFDPNTEVAPYAGEGDVLEMPDVPINDLMVMVVESNPQLADIIRRDLLKYVKVTLHDGGEGFEQVLREVAPVAVVMDMQLDESVNPFDNIHTIRTLSSACIVVISDFSNKRDIIRVIQSEADDFLLKPFSCQVLTALVLKHIRKMTVPEAEEESETAEEVIHRPYPLLSSGDEKHVVVLEKRKDKFLLDRMNSLIASNMGNAKFDVNSLAESLKISRGQLYKKLKEFRNMTPVEYLRNQRLERAATLLSESPEMTVQEVMLQVGMPDAANFYRRFKEKYGMSPNQYKLRMNNE